MGGLLGDLLTEELSVVTAGAELFDSTLRAQGVITEAVDWRPPVPGSETWLAAIAMDPRTVEANQAAVGQMLAARPYVVDVMPAREAIPELHDKMLLHAGPPIEWADTSGPLRGAVIGALLYEKWADTASEAERLMNTGNIELNPNHHFGAVGPMAGVVSPSMPMWVVENQAGRGRACCTLNEGLGKVLRQGAYGPEITDRLAWMEAVLGPMLSAALRLHGPLDARGLISQAIQMGDEGHNRNRAGTSLLFRELAANLVEVDAPASDIADVLRFINGNDHFFLNVTMPTAKTAADEARNVTGSTMVVAMARNGTEFGIQTSGTGDRWFVAPAPMADGLYLPGFGPEDANPDMGDSTIMETVGLGGFAMAAAPAIVRFVGGTATDALQHTQQMYEITLAEHDAYQIPILEFRGTPTGIDVTKVVRTGILPSVNTGIAGKIAGTGQVGAGLVVPPLACFGNAVRAIAQQALPPHLTEE